MGLRRLITEFLWPPSSSIIRPWLPYSIKVLVKTNQTSPNSMGLRRLITEFLYLLAPSSDADYHIESNTDSKNLPAQTRPSLSCISGGVEWAKHEARVVRRIYGGVAEKFSSGGAGAIDSLKLFRGYKPSRLCWRAPGPCACCNRRNAYRRLVLTDVAIWLTFSAVIFYLGERRPSLSFAWDHAEARAREPRFALFPAGLQRNGPAGPGHEPRASAINYQRTPRVTRIMEEIINTLKTIKMDLENQRQEIRDTGKNITEQVTQNISRMFEEKFLTLEKNHENPKERVENQEKGCICWKNRQEK
ncbi:hypothetical protein EVAR_29932_1 [Eumeta japonica]|uniref:Uncharacterized protein n=1 Tax=Eumeta variegata TaxID=151549 RepID=A0A4C1VA42_EUMVA|nr:hypothetical protein EVAR_29932_1 [Eumeta japonica]